MCPPHNSSATSRYPRYCHNSIVSTLHASSRVSFEDIQHVTFIKGRVRCFYMYVFC